MMLKTLDFLATILYNVFYFMLLQREKSMIFCPKIRIYTVHIKPDLARAAENPIFVREGFSWKAFFFGFLWSFYHRLWLVSTALMAVSIVFLLASEHKWLDAGSLLILQIAFSFFVGFSANDWRRKVLCAHGYITYDIVASDSEIRAQQRYFERMLA